MRPLNRSILVTLLLLFAASTAWLPAEEAAPSLSLEAQVAQLGHEDFKQRRATQKAIAAMVAEDPDQLRPYLKSDDPEIRARVRGLYARLKAVLPLRATLLSRSRHSDYEKATFSFEYGLRDDPTKRVRNDWDLQFGNGGDYFSVTMVTDDRSRILDLGAKTWATVGKLPELKPHPAHADEPRVPAVEGHLYLVRTKDSESDLLTLFRVEKLVAGDTCEISWKLVDE